jgi:predicted Mrr-cat superfamily restriction endonuclease
MPNIWMIRAGESGRYVDEFAKGYVAVGWQELGDMSSFNDKEEMLLYYLESYPHEKKEPSPMVLPCSTNFIPSQVTNVKKIPPKASQLPENR